MNVTKMKYSIEKDLVTIAIPAYKDSYLSDAIDSALQQDYDNIELIIVNDNSPYDLDNIVSRYKDKRIRYYKNKRNLGKRSIVLNWNKCLEYAHGEFFVLLCDDDVLYPNFVSELLKLVIQYPLCNVFHARKVEKDERTGIEEESPIWPPYEQHKEYVDAYFNEQRKHTISEFLYRTSAINDIQYIVFPVGFYSDDASIIEFTKVGGIASSQIPLMMFRYSQEHISSNGDYNIGKARAMRQFLRWARKEKSCQPYLFDKTKKELDASIGYFIQCKGWKKFLVVPYIPWTKSNIRIIWIVFVKMLLHRY